MPTPKDNAMISDSRLTIKQTRCVAKPIRKQRSQANTYVHSHVTYRHTDLWRACLLYWLERISLASSGVIKPSF